MAYVLTRQDVYGSLTQVQRVCCFDGTYFWSAGGNGDIYTFDYDGSDLTYRHTLNSSSSNLDGQMVSDGTYVYACDGSDLYAFSYDGSTITEEGSTTENINYLSWDGSYLYGITGSALHAFTFNGSNFTKHGSVWPGGGNASGMTSDGSYIYTSKWTSDYLYAYSFNGSTFTEEDSLSAPFVDSNTRLMHDGTYIIAYNGGAGDDIQAYQFSGGTLSSVGNAYAIGSSTVYRIVYDGTYYHVVYGAGYVYTLSFDGSDWSLEDQDQLSDNQWQHDICRDGNNIFTVGGKNNSPKLQAVAGYTMALTAQIGYDSLTGQAPHTVNFTAS